MAIVLQGVSHPQHKDGGVQVEHGFLHGNPADIKTVSQKDHEHGYQHHQEAEPAQTAAKSLRKAVNRINNCMNSISHPNTNGARNTLLWSKLQLVEKNQ